MTCGFYVSNFSGFSSVHCLIFHVFLVDVKKTELYICGVGSDCSVVTVSEDVDFYLDVVSDVEKVVQGRG